MNENYDNETYTSCPRFGTYDFHRPDNSTHCVAVSGKIMMTI